MTTPAPDTERGLYGKYLVFKSGGDMVPVTDPCFILRYDHDVHAAVALAAYAESCAADYPQLAADLREKLREKPECDCHEPACQWCEVHGETGNSPITDHDPQLTEGATMGDDYHRLGHIPTWEPSGDDNRVCTLCGFIECAGAKCGWWVGPVWKLDGETCVCYMPQGHAGAHLCSCGSWFEGCGHPPEQRSAG